MKKYKLRIPEFINKEDAGFVAHLNQFKELTGDQIRTIEMDFNDHIPKGWLQEIAEESAFREWNQKQPVVVGENGLYSWVNSSRKEGWNAALDEVLKLNRFIVDLVKPGPDHSVVIVDSVKKLKED